MSSKLSSILVQAGAVPVRKVEEAIQRQVIYGGSLGTNLLEMGALDEDSLLVHLARATGLPPADYRWLHQPDPEAQKLFPRKLADRYQLVPVGVRGGVLLGVVADALDPAVLDELSFMLGLELRPHIVPELRYLQALELHYGVPLRPRFRNLLRKLDAGPRPAGSDLRSLSEEFRLEMIGTGAAAGQGERAVDLTAAALAAGLPDPVLVSGPTEPELSVHAPAASTPAPDAPTRTPAGPPPGAAVGLAGPSVTLTSSPTLPVIPASPTLPASPGAPGFVEGQEQRQAAPAPTEAFGDPGPPPAAAGLPTPRWTLEQASGLLLEQEDRDGLMAVAFSYFSGRLDNIYAFAVRGSGIRSYLAWGLGAVEFEQLGGCTLELADPSPTLEVCRSRRHYLGPLDHDAVLAELFSLLGRTLPTEALMIPVVLRERTVLLLVSDNGERPIESASLAEALVFVPLLATGLERMILQQKRQGTGGGERVEVPQPVATPQPAIVTPRAVVAPVQPVQPVEPAPAVRLPSDVPVKIVFPPGELAGEAPPVRGDRQPLADSGAAAPVEAPLSVSTAAGAAPSDEPPSLPPPVIELTRVLRQRATEEGDASEARTVIPPAEPPRSISALLRSLGDEQSRPTALAELRQYGVEALDGCLRAFPGPLTVDRESLLPGRYPPVEEHGPVLALLVELGQPVLARLARELDSMNIANRFYATLVIGRIGEEAAIPLVADRLFDPVGLVRQAAREVLVRFASQEGLFGPVRARLASELMQADNDHARWAAEAAAFFHDGESVELLYPLLKEREPPVREAALAALREITRRDLGPSVRAWRRWYERFRHQERLAWLIDALVEEDADLRAGAAQELHRLTGQRIPFDVQGPRKEWKRAQGDWQSWYRNRRPEA